MNTIIKSLFGLVAGCAFACCLSLFTSQAFAIEGLNITVPPTNVVLSWPSDPSESYLIQYRHTLDATDSWTTLADYYPPDYTGLNITYFYDTNIDYGFGGSSDGGGGSLILPATQTLSTSTSLTFAQRAEQLSEMISNLIPETIARNNSSTMRMYRNSPQSPQPQPMDNTNSASNAAIPGTGFYRVVRDGVHLVGISNDMVLSGVVTIPVELGNDAGDVVSINISENDSPIANSIQVMPLSNPQAITLDTTVMANGIHYINGNARWEDANNNSWEIDSPSFSVTTSNEITFENWMPMFGELDNTLLIRATSAHTDTDWQIDVYDSTNNYVGSFTGHTYDGDIYVVWNLFDYFGVQHTNDNFFTCKVSTEYIDPLTPKTYKQTDPWFGSGGWAFGIQHAFDNLTDANMLYEELDGFYGAAKAKFPVGPTTGSEPFAIDFQGGNETNEWATFIATIFLPAARNLVYFGHGGPNGIGYSQNNTNVSLTVNQIANALHTIPAGQTNAHKFRFVFLDGCSTGKGKLPEAFGILHKENVQQIDYYNSSTRPSAFVGWTSDKAIGFALNNAINYDHVNFMTYIQDDMFLNGAGIGDAIAYASSQPLSFIITSQLKCYGCPSLTFGAFNN